MVKQVGNQTCGCKLEFQGESTDIKPVLESKHDGSTFLELDTTNVYVLHNGQWRKLGG